MNFFYRFNYTFIYINQKQTFMLRIPRNWNQKNRKRTVSQTASAIASNIWKLSSKCLLNLENEGFDTHTIAQRLDVIQEIAAFLIHIVDRHAYKEFDEQKRLILINDISQSCANLMHSSRLEIDGESDHRKMFIEKLNIRLDEYANDSYESEGPGFAMKRSLGNNIMAIMGETDNKWIPTYIIDQEAPKLMVSFRRVLNSFVKQ